MSEILKKKVAEHALKYVPKDTIIGIGSGTTIRYFIEALKSIRFSILGAVSSSVKSSNFLKRINIKLYNLNEISKLEIYIDSADEINHNLEMIKGGGGALTQEKIISSVSKKFICIVDESKFVKKLGSFPLPIEVIPISLNYVSRELIKLGGHPKHRKNFVTDNGNFIIDVFHLNFDFPKKLEKFINNISGVVTVGLFSFRKADVLLVCGRKYFKVVY
ncbi:ribose-5-phosphate isomerase RpiA [Buchnera aphidicola]|uniref:Ribose-5-phosphate isomerase A n=1 Tax=Buchnera aphidicola subsp. Tuberolachnus salignus TaxID=98804 RepID=A0A160SX42_BUCTT|nr:ribose-5-phosphate isomerase RpiA [Buchnera aphidicola]CUR53248.1 Ribose-5-phosphate isomerase A [Buchnera aphidicola (Tuberolachnus salignus)]